MVSNFTVLVAAVADGPPGQWLASQLIVAFGCSLDVHLSGINVARPSDPVREVVSTATRVRLDGSAASTADGIAPESTLSVCSNAFLEGDAGQEYRRRQLAKYFYGMREAYATKTKFACAPDVGSCGKQRYLFMPMTTRRNVACIPAPTAFI